MRRQADTRLLESGVSFGSYRIVDLIGVGGMGQVYLAEHEGTGGRFAIKVMDPTAPDIDAGFAERFVLEADFSSRLDSPHLVRTHETGRDPETGLCFIVMEYMPGGSLRDIIEASPRGMSLAGAAAVARDLAGALEFMSANSIVHRDVKPDNVLFSADGRAKLADLGISRFLRRGQDAKVTSAGDIVGTPAYMAPEQMMDSSSVDSRADVYSLGVMLFEMLAGRRPNEGESAMNSFAKAIGGRAFPDVRTIRPDAPAAWAELVADMTAPSPAARMPVGGAVAALKTLGDVPARQTVSAPAPPRRRIDGTTAAALAALVFSLLALAAAVVRMF